MEQLKNSLNENLPVLLIRKECQKMQIYCLRFIIFPYERLDYTIS